LTGQGAGESSRGSFKTAGSGTIEAAVEQFPPQGEIATDPKASSQRPAAAAEASAPGVKERAAQARAALEKVRAEKEKRAKTHAPGTRRKSPSRKLAQ